jgi:nucleoside-diphosphate-sugar epimerase
MRVLVTGHQGYLGSVLVQRLIDGGHEPVGADTGYFADCIIGPAPVSVPMIRMDLRDITVSDLSAHGSFDAVIHLAALSNDPLGSINAGLTYDINYHATVTLAEAAKATGITRFLYASSCSLYGAGDDESPLTEDAAFAPITPYGESKYLSETKLRTLADDDFSPVFLRNATAYGFSPRLRGDLVVNDLVGHAVLTGEVRLLSDGSAWRPLVHAEDICGAFLAMLEADRDRIHNKAFNIGQTEENFLISTVAKMVHEVVGGEITFGGRGDADKRNYRVSCDLVAAEIPEFKPQWTLRMGIEQLAEAYQRHGLRLEDLTGERHQRLKRIKSLQATEQLDADLRWSTVNV